jgi:type IV secretory pathway TraG/TraD family ATPase VirD4
MSHQSTAIRDDFILSRIVSHGLGCMGLGLLRDDSDTSRIATFIKGTLRDLIMTLIPPQKCKLSGMLICDEFNLIRDRMVTSQIK